MAKTALKTQMRKRRHARQQARIQGTAERPRLVVYKSLTTTYAQLIDDAAGKTLVESSDIKITKGTKTERAVEAGKTLAEKAKKAGIETCVFDRNGFKYHGRIKALADAAREAGLKF